MSPRLLSAAFLPRQLQPRAGEADSSHVPSHAWIDRNVRPSLFEEQRVTESLAKWRAGETVTPGLGDIMTALKFPLIFLVLAIIYHFVVWYAGGKLRVCWS